MKTQKPNPATKSKYISCCRAPVATQWIHCVVTSRVRKTLPFQLRGRAMTRVKPITRTRAGRAVKISIRKRSKVLAREKKGAAKVTQSSKVIHNVIDIATISTIFDSELFIKPLMLGDELSDLEDSPSTNKNDSPKKDRHTTLSDRWPISLALSQINDPLCAEFFGKPGRIRGEERTI